MKKSINLQNNQPQYTNEKDFNEVFMKIFNKIITAEQELDTIRELLNEQISFNLKDLYVIVAGNANSISYKHIINFLKAQANECQLISPLQSIIRFYNGNTSLNLSFSEFSSFFLNRQNRLLMKMTLERESIGTLPNYILNYSKKILTKQVELHQELIQFRKMYSKQTEQLIKLFLTIDQYLDESKMIDYLCIHSKKAIQQVKVQFDVFLRYLKPFAKVRVQKQVLESLLTLRNVQNVSEYLRQFSKKKSTAKCASSDKLMKTFNDPFIRQQFHDCLSRPKVIDMFSYRQIKSIEKHLDRLNQHINQNQQITTKIQKFKTVVEKNSKKVLEAIKDILWLQKQIQYARIDLNLCPDFYPVLFFQCFHKDKQNRIIPSAMEIYFKQFGIRIPLNQIYLLFKRYAWHLQGKMDFNSFCSIFDVCQAAYSRIQKNRQIKSLADVDIETKKNFLLLLATIIKNQKKMQMIKSQLQKIKQMSLRDVFACFDTDQDSYLSITDFRIIWKKYFNIQIAEQMIKLLWFRMGYTNQSEIIKYEQFIKQMIPKSKLNSEKKLKKVKSLNNFFNKCGKQNTKKIK